MVPANTNEDLISRDKALSVYVEQIKPFLLEYEKKNKQLPTWKDLDKKFGEKVFKKSGARAFFQDLVNKYNKKELTTYSKNKEGESVPKKSPNKRYNADIGGALEKRFEAIKAVSNTGDGRGRKSITPFTKDEARAVAKLL